MNAFEIAITVFIAIVLLIVSLAIEDWLNKED